MNSKQNGETPQNSEKVGEIVSIFKRGRRWHANFQHAGKQHRPSLQTASKKEARSRAIRLEAQIIDGSFASPFKAAPFETVTSAYLSVLRTEGKAKKTLQKVELVVRRILDLVARRKIRNLAEINLAFLDAYRAEAIARRRKPAAPKTLLNETVIIRQIINFALSRNMIGVDPLKGLKLKKVKPKPQPCWERADVEKILAAAGPANKAAFHILAETGMRVGELRWLTWDDIDFARKIIRIRPKDEWKPKTGDQRAIPMTSLQHLLEDLPRRGRWVVTAAVSKRHPEAGRQVSERRLLVCLKRLLARLGLPGHLHTFRHSFISQAITQGIPEAVVRSWVGHVDQDVLKLYTHIADEASQAAMRRLSNANAAQRQSEASEGTKSG